MYKLLIVDDESWIRRGIRAKLKKHGFQFAWIGEADNGNSAIEVITEIRPDIVLVDIKMDGMDGLQLMERVRRARVASKFIVISGHSDFAFAERAINEGARGYILKPIESRLFVQRLQSVIIELDRERGSTGSPEDLLGAGGLHALGPPAELSGATWSAEGGEERTWQFCALGIIRVDSTNSQSSIMDIRAREAIRRRLVVELVPMFSGKSVSLFEDRRFAANLLFLCAGPDEAQVRVLTEATARKVHAKATASGYSVTVGCSDVEVAITRTLHAKARTALDRRLFEGTGAIYHYTEDRGFDPVDEQDLRFLEQHMHHVNLPEIKRCVYRILSRPRGGRQTAAYLRDAYFAVAQTAIRCIGKEEQSTVDREFALLLEEGFEQFEDVQQLADRCFEIVSRALSRGEPNSSGAAEDRVEQICRYIEEHFSLEISTQQLASEFHLNANYLSTLFRMRTGLTISAYIAHARINAACRLLRETSMSVAQTAETVGYLDPKYFHKVFKKVKGLTPGEFRDGVLPRAENSTPGI